MSNQRQPNQPHPPQLPQPPDNTIPLFGLKTELYRVPVIRRMKRRDNQFQSRIFFTEKLRAGDGHRFLQELTKQKAYYLLKKIKPLNIPPTVERISVQINLLFYLGRIELRDTNGTVGYHENRSDEEILEYWRHYARRQPGLHVFGNRYRLIYCIDLLPFLDWSRQPPDYNLQFIKYAPIHSIYPCIRYEFRIQPNYVLTYGLCFQAHDDRIKDNHSKGQSYEDRQYNRFNDYDDTTPCGGHVYELTPKNFKDEMQKLKNTAKKIYFQKVLQYMYVPVLNLL